MISKSYPEDHGAVQDHELSKAISVLSEFSSRVYWGPGELCVDNLFVLFWPISSTIQT